VIDWLPHRYVVHAFDVKSRVFGTAPPEEAFGLWLLCLLLKNGSFRKIFGRTSSEELEPEPEEPYTKQDLQFTYVCVTDHTEDRWWLGNWSGSYR
jgi:hypothetical protein